MFEEMNQFLILAFFFFLAVLFLYVGVSILDHMVLNIRAGRTRLPSLSSLLLLFVRFFLGLADEL